MGRRAHQPDPVARRQVEAMSAYGIPETDIARVIGIDPKTLRRHYRDELDTGHIKANSRMAENLFKKAMGDGPQAVTATIFWLKTRAQWRETAVREPEISLGDAVRMPASVHIAEIVARFRAAGHFPAVLPPPARIMED